MTTIATDGVSMAGDGRRNHRGTITNDSAVKVARLPDGSLFGRSGSVAFGDKVQAWLEGGCKDPPPEYKTDGGFGAMLLRPDGTLFIIGEDVEPSAVQIPFAVGSGMDIAIGAMAAGKTAEEAVRIASRYDSNTGGKITSLNLKEAE
jgi:hypothetical protein